METGKSMMALVKENEGEGYGYQQVDIPVPVGDEVLIKVKKVWVFSLVFLRDISWH